jgi:uncharacterized protein YndB with AHSA1/START domain
MAEKNRGPAGSAGEKQVVITRVFEAPRALVWKAWTERAHVEAWWAPRGFSTRVEELDLRPGGRTNYVMTGPDGAEYPAEGVFREIVPMERIVTTGDFGEEYRNRAQEDLPGAMVATYLFEDAGEEKTRVTIVIDHPTVEDRRKHEEMGVLEGWGSSLDCLEDHLAAQGGA